MVQNYRNIFLVILGTFKECFKLLEGRKQQSLTVAAILYAKTKRMARIYFHLIDDLKYYIFGIKIADVYTRHMFLFTSWFDLSVYVEVLNLALNVFIGAIFGWIYGRLTTLIFFKYYGSTTVCAI